MSEFFLGFGNQGVFFFRSLCHKMMSAVNDEVKNADGQKDCAVFFLADCDKIPVNNPSSVFDRFFCRLKLNQPAATVFVVWAWRRGQKRRR